MTQQNERMSFGLTVDRLRGHTCKFNPALREQPDEDQYQLQPPGVQRLAGLDLHHLQLLQHLHGEPRGPGDGGGGQLRGRGQLSAGGGRPEALGDDKILRGKIAMHCMS